MPPHNPTGNVVPLYGQPVDYPQARFVRPLSPEHCARALNDEEMLAAIERQLRGDLRPVRHITIMDDLRNDWRSMIEGIRNEPYTHGLIAILGFLAGLLLVALPVLVGVGK